MSTIGGPGGCLPSGLGCVPWENCATPLGYNIEFIITGPSTHSVGGPVLFYWLSSVTVCRLSLSVALHGAIIRLEAASPAQARR